VTHMALRPAATFCRPLLLATTLVLAVSAVSARPAQPAEIQSNVGLHLSFREILFFSAPTGQWVPVRLDPGEQVLQRGADGNVAAVVTSLRAIGFSGPIGAMDEIRLTDEDTLDTLRVEGNIATVLTKRRALGFSAFTAKWVGVDRAFPGHR
jgi:hypothetical protein